MQKNISNQTPRQILESKFNSARNNILLVVIFTAINIFLLATNSNTYFLFSAYIPFALVDLAMFFCGMYPAEFYVGNYALGTYLDRSVFFVVLAIAAVILVLYLLAWLLSKKNKVGWLVFALVFFGIDTLLMFGLKGIAMESIVDIIFHGWVVISLIMGISAYAKLKKLPAESVLPADAQGIVPQDTPMLRFADEEVKARTLLEAEAAGHKIVYRRVKRVNELVIDGKVYDEYVALLEFAHTLKACVDGHTIEAGIASSGQSFIVVDGQIITQKLRFF